MNVYGGVESGRARIPIKVRLVREDSSSRGWCGVGGVVDEEVSKRRRSQQA